MSISNTISSITFICDGVQTVFPANDFYILQKQDIVVYLENTTTGNVSTLVLDTDYSVTISGQSFSITTVQTYANTYKLIVQRNLEFLQPAEFSPYTGVNASVLNVCLDRLTMFCQELEKAISSKIGLAVSSALENIVVQEGPGKFLKWKTDGSGIEAVGISGTGAFAAGDGIDITDNTISLDVNSLVEKTIIDINNDFLPVFDNNTGLDKKIKLAKLNDPAASFVTVSANTTLPNERVLTAGTGITLNDAGAGGNLTLNSFIKAACIVDMYALNVGGGTALLASYNVTSVTSSGSGYVSVNFATPFPSAIYGGHATCADNGTTGVFFTGKPESSSKWTGFAMTDAGALANPPFVLFTFYSF